MTLKKSFWSIENFTVLAAGVAMTQGAMVLALMLSLAHSHAKFLDIWLIAPLVAP